MKNELESLKIINTEGQELEIKVVSIIETSDKLKKFIIYTFDDKVENVELYASKIIESNDSYELDAIDNNEDWNFVQDKIKELLK